MFDEKSLYLPDEPDAEEDADGLEVEGDEDEDEQTEMEERGEACSDCGEPFTESNGTPALCAECHEAAEDRGEKPLQKSKFPLRG